MGLLNSLAGKVLGSSNGLALAAMEMFNKNGGLVGILDQFKAAGFSEQVASWVGLGDNLPISAEQITRALGDDQLAKIATKLNIEPAVLSNKIAQHLPSIVDKMTPNGEVGANSNNLLGVMLSLLKQQN